MVVFILNVNKFSSCSLSSLLFFLFFFNLLSSLYMLVSHPTVYYLHLKITVTCMVATQCRMWAGGCAQCGRSQLHSVS